MKIKGLLTKGDSNIESKLALIKPCNLPQTGSMFKKIRKLHILYRRELRAMEGSHDVTQSYLNTCMQNQKKTSILLLFNFVCIFMDSSVENS